jgi:hypothetical protein
MTIVAEKELSSEEMESFRNELAEIKADMMRKELEEIKKERSAGSPVQPQRPVQVQAPSRSALSLSNLIIAALMLLVAGYLIGTAYSTDVTGSFDNLFQSFSLPMIGSLVVAAIAILLAVLGVALMTIARK